MESDVGGGGGGGGSEFLVPPLTGSQLSVPPLPLSGLRYCSIEQFARNSPFLYISQMVFLSPDPPTRFFSRSLLIPADALQTHTPSIEYTVQPPVGGLPRDLIQVSSFGRLNIHCLWVAGPWLKVHLGEVSPYDRLKMQCFFVAGTTTECPLSRVVPLWVICFCGRLRRSVCVWLGTRLSVCLGEVSSYGRLNMQCLFVAGTMTECPLMGGKIRRVCVWLGPWLSACLGKVSSYGRLNMQCLFVAGTMTECPLRRGIR